MVDLHSYLQIKRRELKERIEFKNRNKTELFWEKIQLIVFYVWIEIRSLNHIFIITFILNLKNLCYRFV